MVEFISGLIKKKKAYVGSNGVYYKVKLFPHYGKLSKKTTNSLESGARVEIDETIANPCDFALWNFLQKNQGGKARGGMEGMDGILNALQWQ